MTMTSSDVVPTSGAEVPEEGSPLRDGSATEDAPQETPVDDPSGDGSNTSNSTPKTACWANGVPASASSASPKTKGRRQVPTRLASASKPASRSNPPPQPPQPPGSGLRSLRSLRIQPTSSGVVRTPLRSRPLPAVSPASLESGTNVARSGVKATTDRAPAMETPLRKMTPLGGNRGAAAGQPTPRQAAISAKKELLEQRRREAALHKQQQLEMKSVAKAKQAEQAAEHLRLLREREERAKKRRLEAAAKKKAIREQQTRTQASELREKMEERRELEERMKMEEKTRRRESLAYRSAAWKREREMKRAHRQAMKEEQKLIMEGHEVFREAKSCIKKQQDRADRQERSWRANRAFVEKSLEEGEGDKQAYEDYQARVDRVEDQAALDQAAREENRLRRSSAQWRRNKMFLDREIERGSGKGLNPFMLTNDLLDRAESRKENAEYREAQKALERESQHQRRRSDLRKKGVEVALREREKEKEAELDASRIEDKKDAEAYRQECRRRERESLVGRRQKLFDDKTVERWTIEIAQEAEAEDRELKELGRQDCQEYQRRVREKQKLEEEYARQQQFKDRLFKQEEEQRKKEQEDEERRKILEDRESVSASKWREEQMELDRKNERDRQHRREELRGMPSEATKMDILEAIWAKQAHPAAAAAAAARGRPSRSTLCTVTEEVSFPSDLDISGGGRGGGVGGDMSSSGSSSSSGMGIKGRKSSGAGFCGSSDEDSLLRGWPGSEEEQDEKEKELGCGRGRGGAGGCGGSADSAAAVSLMGQPSVELAGHVRLTIDVEGEDEDSNRSWKDVLEEEGGSAPAALLEEGGGGREVRTIAGRPDYSNMCAPAWEDVSAIEEQEAAAIGRPITTVTAAAAAVLAAAEQSFTTDSSTPNRGEGYSCFPARTLVFSGDQGRREEGEGEGVAGSIDGSTAGCGVSPGALKISDYETATATTGTGTAGATIAEMFSLETPGAAADVEDDESGVLMMSKTEAGVSREEEEDHEGQHEEEEEEERVEDEGEKAVKPEEDEEEASQGVKISRSVVSFDDDERESGVEDGGGRESSVVGSAMALTAEEATDASIPASEAAGAPTATPSQAQEDPTLASVDSNDGTVAAASKPVVGADVDAALNVEKEQRAVQEEVHEEHENGCKVTPAKTLVAGENLLGAVPATPVTPDDS